MFYIGISKLGRVSVDRAEKANLLLLFDNTRVSNHLKQQLSLRVGVKRFNPVSVVRDSRFNSTVKNAGIPQK